MLRDKSSWYLLTVYFLAYFGFLFISLGWSAVPANELHHLIWWHNTTPTFFKLMSHIKIFYLHLYGYFLVNINQPFLFRNFPLPLAFFQTHQTHTLLKLTPHSNSHHTQTRTLLKLIPHSNSHLTQTHTILKPTPYSNSDLTQTHTLLKLTSHSNSHHTQTRTLVKRQTPASL